MTTGLQLGAIERKDLIKQAESLNKSSHFNQAETLKLLYYYRGITTEKIDRVTFCDLLNNKFGMTDDYFMDKVFKALDHDSDGYLDQKEWVKGLSMFLRGTLDEKMEYCFSIYDINGDGFITREEMFYMLKNTIVTQPTEEDPDEGIRDLVETAIKKLDLDHDSKVSLTDFKTAVGKETLLIETFGPCLPERKYVDDFIEEVLAS